MDFTRSVETGGLIITAMARVRSNVQPNSIPAGIFLALLATSGLLACLFAAPQDDPWRKPREAMVRQQLRDVSDPRVLDALRTIPRHLFVPPEQQAQAYDDHPLPIGSGQTISQPYIVAKMTELLRLKKDDRVFELGTGSGYQAAVLSRLVKEVYTVEIFDELGQSARQRLKRLGYSNVEVKVGDAYYGWPEKAPFDAIIVTAAANHIPPPLIQQLKPGGRMVIPIGTVFQVQNLLLVEKGRTEKDLKIHNIMPVLFVPLLGGHEESR